MLWSQARDVCTRVHPPEELLSRLRHRESKLYCTTAPGSRQYCPTSSLYHHDYIQLFTLWRYIPGSREDKPQLAPCHLHLLFEFKMFCCRVRRGERGVRKRRNTRATRPESGGWRWTPGVFYFVFNGRFIFLSVALERTGNFFQLLFHEWIDKN